MRRRYSGSSLARLNAPCWSSSTCGSPRSWALARPQIHGGRLVRRRASSEVDGHQDMGGGCELDSDRFDGIARLLAERLSRRGAATGIAALAAVGLVAIDNAESKKKKKRKRKRKRKRNKPCKQAEATCKKASECCESRSCENVDGCLVSEGVKICCGQAGAPCLESDCECCGDLSCMGLFVDRFCA